MKNSIFEELKKYIPDQNKKNIIEMRCSHSIHSMINILKDLQENFDEKEYCLLEKKIILSLKKKDPNKFLKKLKNSKLKEKK